MIANHSCFHHIHNPTSSTSFIIQDQHKEFLCILSINTEQNRGENTNPCFMWNKAFHLFSCMLYFCHIPFFSSSVTKVTVIFTQRFHNSSLFISSYIVCTHLVYLKASLYFPNLAYYYIL